MDIGPAILVGLGVAFVLRVLLPAMVQSGVTFGGKGKPRKEVEQQNAHGKAQFAKDASKQLGRRRG